jgi:hypothetical protein
MKTHVTITLTKEQAEALEWMLAYGIDEKEYILKLERDYTEEETEEQRISLTLAKQALCIVQGKIYLRK